MSRVSLDKFLGETVTEMQDDEMMACRVTPADLYAQQRHAMMSVVGEQLRQSSEPARSNKFEATLFVLPDRMTMSYEVYCKFMINGNPMKLYVGKIDHAGLRTQEQKRELVRIVRDKLADYLAKEIMVKSDMWSSLL